VREREAQVLQLSARGRTQREIAAEVGVTQPAVWKILRRIEDRLLATMHRERIRLLVRLQIRTDHVYREAQHGWERSCTERHRRRQRRTTSAGPTPSEREVVEVWSESQSGDPRFLREQLRAVAEQRATFQLDALDWADIGTALEEAAEGPNHGDEDRD
jgi:DNA-binding CsgD family transcriptional regulator